jgi:hypothetical protein
MSVKSRKERNVQWTHFHHLVLDGATSDDGDLLLDDWDCRQHQDPNVRVKKSFVCSVFAL